MNTPADTVLIIEDDSSTATLIAHWLQRDTAHAWRVQIAHTLAEALTALTADTPAVVLLDLNLPDGRGLSTLMRLFVALPPAPALIPIVVITGQEDTETALGVTVTGAGFIGKNRLMETPDDLLTLLHRLVTQPGAGSAGDG